MTDPQTANQAAPIVVAIVAALPSTACILGGLMAARADRRKDR
jgi:hypothetical protein